MMPLNQRVSSARHQRDYSPIHWSEYFDEAHDVLISTAKPKSDYSESDNTLRQEEQDKLEDSTTEKDSFRVYLKNFKEPYAPKREFGHRLNSREVDVSEAELRAYTQVPTLVALHGGGYSGLTWAQFTHDIVRQCKCRVLAIDLRSHGDTKTTTDDKMDIDTLIDDVVAVILSIHSEICGFIDIPKLVLIGHSMGGAIAIKCAYRCANSLPMLAGFVVIDVVEGTAKDALPQMLSVIKTRPIRFPSLANAIEWTVRSGMAKNADAARVSMPGNLLNISTNQLAIHDIERPQEGTETVTKHKYHISVDKLIGPSLPSALLPPRLPLPMRVRALGGAPDLQVELTSSIPEERETETHREAQATASHGYRKPGEVDTTGYTWRTDLAKTQPHWNGWFEGLSHQMLQSQVQGKFLLLAGIDRLDKALTIGQMQGKFMMKVLPKCGHAVHEDVPDQVASAISEFLIRNKFTVMN